MLNLSKKNKKNTLSNPYHSGNTRHLLGKSKLERQIDNISLIVKSSIDNTITFFKNCFYNKNFFKKIIISYNSYIHRGVIINDNHKPLKNTELRKIYNRRIPENIFRKIYPYASFILLPFYPTFLFLSKLVISYQNRKEKKKINKCNKKHFKSFKKINQNKIFSINENKKKIKKSIKKNSFINKALFNRFAIAILIPCSITGAVIASPDNKNNDIESIFDNNYTQLEINPTKSIKNVDFHDKSIIAYYQSDSSKIELYIPSNVKINGRKSSFVINTPTHHAGLGNYENTLTNKERKWFTNFGMSKSNCSKAGYVAKIKNMLKNKNTFVINKRNEGSEYRSINVSYEDNESKTIYYVKDYMITRTKKELKGYYVCSVELDNSFTNRMSSFFKKI